MILYLSTCTVYEPLRVWSCSCSGVREKHVERSARLAPDFLFWCHFQGSQQSLSRAYLKYFDIQLSHKMMASVTRKSKRSKYKRCSKKATTTTAAATTAVTAIKQIDVVCVNTRSCFLAPQAGNELLFHQVKRQSKNYKKFKDNPRKVKRLSQCIVDSLVKTTMKRCRFIFITIQNNQISYSEMTKSQAIETVQGLFSKHLNETMFSVSATLPSDLKPYLIQHATTPEEPKDLKAPKPVNAVTPEPEDCKPPRSKNIPDDIRLPPPAPAPKPSASTAEAFGMEFALVAPDGVPVVEQPLDDAFIKDLEYLQDISTDGLGPCNIAAI